MHRVSELSVTCQCLERMDVGEHATVDRESSHLAARMWFGGVTLWQCVLL